MTTRKNARQKWEREVTAWRSSGLTQAAYCKQRGLHPASMSHWARRLAPESAKLSEPAFVPVVELRQPAPSLHPASGEGVGCPIAVLTCGGAELVIDAAVSPQWLATLLREVGRC